MQGLELHWKGVVQNSPPDSTQHCQWKISSANQIGRSLAVKISYGYLTDEQSMLYLYGQSKDVDIYFTDKTIEVCTGSFQYLFR